LPTISVDKCYGLEEVGVLHAPQHFLDRHYGLRAYYFPLRTPVSIVAQPEIIGGVSRREQFEGS
jgi:hypothetical protein